MSEVLWRTIPGNDETYSMRKNSRSVRKVSGKTDCTIKVEADHQHLGYWPSLSVSEGFSHAKHLASSVGGVNVSRSFLIR